MPALVSNHCGRRVKVLQSDRGSEYLSTVFTQFLEQKGALRDTKISHSPWLHGILERMNGTFVDPIRTMLHFQGLENGFELRYFPLEFKEKWFSPLG